MGELENQMGKILPHEFLYAYEDILLNLFNKAKQEFPFTTPEKEREPDFWSELASERLQWFKKWFGD